MKATQALHEAGQSLWLDNITRTLLDEGTLAKYIAELSVTGLTSNPTIFEKAITGGDSYDEQVHSFHGSEMTDEQVFFEVAIADLQRAADLFGDIHERTDNLDGFVSLEVSPELAYDTDATVAQAKELHAKVDRSNVFIKIPGTPEGLPAISAAIHAGIPVNVTLLFDSAHALAAADAYYSGLERRVADGLSPNIQSVASLFMSRWDVAVADQVPSNLKDKLGLAIGGRAYRDYRDLLASERVQSLMNEGARPQRLLWASTGTKDPEASDVLYIAGLAAPYTVNTMPEGTLLDYGDHGPAPVVVMNPDGGDCEEVLGEFEAAGVDLGALAAKLQSDGASSFVTSWTTLIEAISTKRSALAGK